MSRRKIRQQHENADGKYNGQCHRAAHHQRLGFLVLRLARVFFILVKTGRISQRLHADDHGIYKIKYTPHKGDLRQCLARDEASVILHLHLDALVGLAHADGIPVLVAHHDAFDHSLPANTGISHLLFSIVKKQYK